MSMGLTQRLRGRRVASVQTNGNLLALRLEDNSEVCIAWVDENGRPVKGQPVMHSSGGRLVARNLHELIRAPGA